MKIRILAEAEAELHDAVLYYEDRCEGLGADLHQSFNEALQTIGRNPLRFPVYEGKALTREFRRALLQTFPYIVVYQVRDEGIVVVAVAHTSREPGYWESRENESG